MAYQYFPLGILLAYICFCTVFSMPIMLILYILLKRYLTNG